MIFFFFFNFLFNLSYVLLFENYEIGNYLKNPTPCSTKWTKEVIKKLEQSPSIPFKWLQGNFIEVKIDKVIWNNYKMSKYLFPRKIEIDSNADRNNVFFPRKSARIFKNHNWLKSFLWIPYQKYLKKCKN